MSKNPHDLPRTFKNLFDYEGFLTILRYYVDLNCFVISPEPGGGETWLAVHYQRRTHSLYDYEKKYEFRFDWSAFLDPEFEKAAGPGKPLLLDAAGFFDTFMPIRRGDRRLGTVLSGAFADHELTLSDLRASWKQLTGREASSENPEFREFTRVLLDTPVLEGEVLAAYREALELFASVLAGEPSAKTSRRLQTLLTDVFSKHLPHSYFLPWAFGLPTAQATPLWNLDVEKMDWVRTDVRLGRIPTTAIAVVPVGPGGRRRDPVEEMFRVYRFQRRCFEFSRTLPQTLGGRLENYGAVFVTSADPSLSRPQRRRQILETAQRIHRFAVEELGGDALVGVGESVAPGQSLGESYRQAVRALHLRRDRDKDLVFFAPGLVEKAEGVAELDRLLADLRRRFESGAFSRLGEAVDAFLNQVLTLSFQSPEEIRWHLHYALREAGEALRNRSDLEEADFTRMARALSQAVEQAATRQEMVLAFQDGLEKLVGLSRNPGRTGDLYSLEKVRRHLERNFQSPLNLARLARLAGVSPSTLSRRFKAAHGAGLETYLQDLRLQEARRLLSGGSLPLSQVARACGFKSPSYFVRFFTRKTRQSPGQYRKRAKPS